MERERKKVREGGRESKRAGDNAARPKSANIQPPEKEANRGLLVGEKQATQGFPYLRKCATNIQVYFFGLCTRKGEGCTRK